MATSKKILLFAPCAFNLAETSRMVEIAKAIERHPKTREAFAVHFISDGGEFEDLIERRGFTLTRMEPRLTKARIEHIAKVDRGEKFAPVLGALWPLDCFVPAGQARRFLAVTATAQLYRVMPYG
jgi:hypothetical protein